jgi:hypothetical protein
MRRIDPKTFIHPVRIIDRFRSQGIEGNSGQMNPPTAIGHAKLWTR